MRGCCMRTADRRRLLLESAAECGRSNRPLESAAPTPQQVFKGGKETATVVGYKKSPLSEAVAKVAV